MDKQLEQQVKDLEQRVAALEEQVQAQPTLEEIIDTISHKVKDSIKSITL